MAADVRFAVQVAACLVLAAYSARAYRARDRRRLSGLTATYELEPARRIWWLRLWYVVSKFASSAGFLGLALFAARLIFAAT